MAAGDNAHWMEKAFANAHGQFKAKAKKHGESTEQFANEATRPGSGASAKTKKQAQLVKNARRG